MHFRKTPSPKKRSPGRDLRSLPRTRLKLYRSSKQSELQSLSTAGHQVITDCFGGFNIETIIARDGVVILSFESEHYPLRALKISDRDSGKHELMIYQILTDHQFCPRVFQIPGSNGLNAFAIAMEYLTESQLSEDNSNLFDRFRDCLEFLRHSLESLQYISQKGIIHCDISPGIIMYSWFDRRYKILDFESAFLQNQQHDHHFISEMKSFIAPEVQSGSERSFPSDIWSLGKVCFRRTVDLLCADVESRSHNGGLLSFYNDILSVPALMVAINPKDRPLIPQLLEKVLDLETRFHQYLFVC